MIELRARTRISDDEMDQKVGKLVTSRDYNALLTGPCRVYKPNGQILAVYLPGALSAVCTDEQWSRLDAIRQPTDNRGMAAAMPRVTRRQGQKRSRTGGGARSGQVFSSILGAFDAYGGDQYCRLTAYTARETTTWRELHPIFQAMSAAFAQHVPDRYANQLRYAQDTEPDWVIPGTVFTTITLNHTYPTGVHTDRGDLDEGFSCLGVLRRGHYHGGTLVLPRYRIGCDLQDGDLIMFDAHEWHGNTAITCAACGDYIGHPGHACGAQPQHSPAPERISIVAYYRTGMRECASLPDEEERRRQVAEMHGRSKLGLA